MCTLSVVAGQATFDNRRPATEQRNGVTVVRLELQSEPGSMALVYSRIPGDRPYLVHSGVLPANGKMPVRLELPTGLLVDGFAPELLTFFAGPGWTDGPIYVSSMEILDIVRSQSLVSSASHHGAPTIVLRSSNWPFSADNDDLCDGPDAIPVDNCFLSNCTVGILIGPAVPCPEADCPCNPIIDVYVTIRCPGHGTCRRIIDVCPEDTSFDVMCFNRTFTISLEGHPPEPPGPADCPLAFPRFKNWPQGKGSCACIKATCS